VKRVYEQGGVLWLSAPEGAAAGDAVYVIQKKSKNKRHPQIVPENLTPYKKRPGFDRAPDVPALFPRRGAETKAGTEKKRTSRTAADTVLPEGIYAAVSCIEDLYIVQSARPAAVIVPLTGKTLPALLNVHGASGTAPLPFKSEDIILSFDPIVTDAAEAEFAAALPRLYELGFRVYIANNISQFSLVESLAASVTRNAGSTAVQTAASAHPAANKAAAHAASVNTAAHGKKNLKKSPAAGPVMIAGPYIYTFNRFAASFAAGAGASYFVMPYEDSRQNLEKTFIAEERQRLFITVYARPALFRIRPNLGAVYSFKQFTDNTADNFNLRPLSADGGGTNTVVTPQTPFSIVDKIPFLKEAGFRRFILDFSGAALKKTAYKDIIKHTETASPIKGASRFNWKNGFYRIKSDE
jgi:putative protease